MSAPRDLRRSGDAKSPETRGVVWEVSSRKEWAFSPRFFLSGRVEPRACRAGSSKSRETRRVSAEKSKRLRSRSVEREKGGARFGFVRALEPRVLWS